MGILPEFCDRHRGPEHCRCLEKEAPNPPDSIRRSRPCPLPWGAPSPVPVSRGSPPSESSCNGVLTARVTFPVIAACLCFAVDARHACAGLVTGWRTLGALLLGPSRVGFWVGVFAVPDAHPGAESLGQREPFALWKTPQTFPSERLCRFGVCPQCTRPPPPPRTLSFSLAPSSQGVPRGLASLPW